jgi:hypothetical protein
VAVEAETGVVELVMDVEDEENAVELDVNAE